jgi:hypothetical protein
LIDELTNNEENTNLDLSKIPDILIPNPSDDKINLQDFHINETIMTNNNNISNNSNQLTL